MKNLLTLIFTLCVLTGVAKGQPPVTGTVRTANGPPPSARVQLRHQGTVVAEAKTDSAGNFVLPAGAAGDTLVAVDVYGFTDTVALATAPVSDHGYRLFLSFQTELVVIESLAFGCCGESEIGATIIRGVSNYRLIYEDPFGYLYDSGEIEHIPDRHHFYRLGYMSRGVGLNNAERQVYESR